MNTHIHRVMRQISNYNYESLIQLFFFIFETKLPECFFVAFCSIFISCAKTILFLTESLSTKLC